MTQIHFELHPAQNPIVSSSFSVYSPLMAVTIMLLPVMPDTTIIHTFVVIALASALVLSHWPRIQAASAWVYLRLSASLNINLVLILCGFISLFLGGVLFGLLLEDAPRNHRFVPYHDRNGMHSDSSKHVTTQLPS
jgi:hypothetical protein